MTTSNEAIQSIESEPFNIEEFVNISIIDSEENYQIMAPENQWPSSWEAKETPLETSSQSFTFSSLETTPLEEYVDPFADLMLPSAAQPQEAEAFKEKLNFRRQKLDDLAKKLSKKDDRNPCWFLDSDCKTRSNHWAYDRTPVQVFSFDAEIPDFKNLYADQYVRSGSLNNAEISSSHEDDLSQEEKDFCSKLLPIFTSLHLL